MSSIKRVRQNMDYRVQTRCDEGVWGEVGTFATPANRFLLLKQQANTDNPVLDVEWASRFPNLIFACCIRLIHSKPNQTAGVHWLRHTSLRQLINFCKFSRWQKWSFSIPTTWWLLLRLIWRRVSILDIAFDTPGAIQRPPDVYQFSGLEMQSPRLPALSYFKTLNIWILRF